MRVETERNTARTLAKSELPEAETEELLPARERLHVMISTEECDASFELIARKNVRELTEYEGAGEHAKSGEVWFDLPLSI